MLRNLKDIEKCTLHATDGDIGQVKDLYFDDHAWVVRYLIVDTGSWLFDRKVLISPISIQKPDWPEHSLPAAITRDQVKNSPDVDTDKPVSRQHEAQYLGYYGYPTYWGGAGMWGGGMFPMEMYPGYAGLPGGAPEREQAIEEFAKEERAKHPDGVGVRSRAWSSSRPSSTANARSACIARSRRCGPVRPTGRRVAQPSPPRGSGRPSRSDPTSARR